MQSNADQSPTNRPMERSFTVQEAAKVLRITPEAVRSRIQRGTLPKEKGEDGTVYVRLNDHQLRSTGNEATDRSRSIDDATNDQPPSVNAVLVEELRERIEHLTEIITIRDEEIRRRDTILMTLAQRIPELEPAQEPREAPESTTERDGRKEPSESQEKVADRRPWYQRWFS
ncbi:MAG: hypothetical protein M3441_28010 [Chloroflexota bacterium]|jgi:hypothetical protein|nr:hypothetical protein [Chloroflexota bacterium]